MKFRMCRAGRRSTQFIVALVTAGAFALALATEARATPPRFSFLDLGTFGGDQSDARSINDAGRVVGWAWTDPGPTLSQYDFKTGKWATFSGSFTLPNAFLYDSHKGGQKVDIGRKDEPSVAEAINNSGRVVGTVGGADDYKRAFRLGFGPLDETVDESFFHPDIRTSLAWDINDRNEIVGNTYLPSGYGAFIYRKNEMVSLGNLLGSPGTVRAINNNGQVVGQSYVNPGYTGPGHAFVHDTRTGQTRDLGTLATEPRPYKPQSHAWDINNNGLVVGTSHADGAFGEEHAFLHDGTKMIDLGTLPRDGDSNAYALNESGHVVGRSGSHAFVWEDGTMYDLNALTDGVTAGWQLVWANDINESGQIVGAVRDITTFGDIYHAFLLTPKATSMNVGPSLLEDDIGQYVGQFSPEVNPLPLLEPDVPEPTAVPLLVAAAAVAGLRRRGHWRRKRAA